MTSEDYFIYPAHYNLMSTAKAAIFGLGTHDTVSEDKYDSIFEFGQTLFNKYKLDIQYDSVIA